MLLVLGGFNGDAEAGADKAAQAGVWAAMASLGLSQVVSAASATHPGGHTQFPSNQIDWQVTGFFSHRALPWSGTRYQLS